MSIESKSRLKTFIIILFVSIALFELFYSAGLVEKIFKTPTYDFTNRWYAVRMMREGVGIYSKFIYIEYIYPPLFAVLILPLTYISVSQAVPIWAFLEFIFYCLAIWLIWYGSPARSRISLLCYFGLTLAGKLVIWRVGHNMDMLLLLLFSAIYFFSARNRNVLAGILLGIAILLKLSPAIFCLYFLLRKKFSIVFVSLITVAAVSLALIPLVGIKGYKDFFFLQHQAKVLTGTMRGIGNQGIYGFWLRLFELNRYTVPAIYSPRLAALFTLLSDAFLLVVTGIAVLRARSRTNQLGEYALFVILLILFAPLSWISYQVWLFIPAIYLLQAYFESGTGSCKWKILLFIAGWLVVATYYDFKVEAFRYGWLTPLLSVKLLGTLIFWFLCVLEVFGDRSNGKAKLHPLKGILTNGVVEGR